MKHSEFEEQREKAREKYNVVALEVYGSTVYVEAEAETGSRYVVVVQDLPFLAAERMGGSQLITVIHPWSAAYPISVYGALHENYIAEKFLPRGRDLSNTHGGDFQALVMTINNAITHRSVL